MTRLAFTRTVPIVNQDLILDIVQRLPQGAVSRAWGWVAQRKRPRIFVESLKRVFVRATGIDMSEAAEPIGAYTTLQDLFVRKLRPGVRRVDPAPSAVVCPVDGKVGACGQVHDGTLLQVKGRSYGLADLLGEPEVAREFEGGPYATIYLAPYNYHRIHAPLAGEIRKAVLIPGGLMPVFPRSVERVDGLFARNERLITYIDSPDAGRLALVKVGATLVGSISVSYDDDLRTNRPGQDKRVVDYDPPRLMSKGGEVGAFELGSTVVLVGQAGKVTFEGLSPGQNVIMGQSIGTLAARTRRGQGTPTSPPEKKTRRKSKS